MTEQPNILLITTDQQRGDCLGIENHPVLQTPNMDSIGASGTHFQRGYSECPSCIPARRVLTCGQAPAVNGMVGYRDGQEWNPPHTLAGELSKAGYQTELVGKLHLHPMRKRYGFDHQTLANSSGSWKHEYGVNEYTDWLATQGGEVVERGVAHGVDANGWVGRPHHLSEEQMHTYWCASRASEFIEKRDPTSPFFLHFSLIDPHPPLTPPAFYYDRYINRELPPPVVGDWVDWLPEEERGSAIASSRVHLDEHSMNCARAAYYGMINFVDDQIGRLLSHLGRRGLLKNTFILFSSDHGEMLGDHHLFRKTFAYEASARVPFLAKAPASWNLPSVQTKAPVGWQDIMPTLLDVAGAEIPATVTGKSLLPLMRGENAKPRAVLHGEHAACYHKDDAVHFLTDGRHKYLWYSQTGKEQLFDLDNDPNELHNLASGQNSMDMLAGWRAELAETLADRPEGFSDGSKLIVGKPHPVLVPNKG